MAINPALVMDEKTGDLVPLPLHDETSITRRHDMELCVQLPSGTLKGKGEVFLTTSRLVFVKEGDHTTHRDFTSFEIPLLLVEEYDFEQTYFRENILRGVVHPNANADNPIGEKATFRLTGGSIGIMSTFMRMMEEICEREREAQERGDVAYVDSSDPSVLYIPQRA